MGIFQQLALVLRTLIDGDSLGTAKREPKKKVCSGPEEASYNQNQADSAYGSRQRSVAAILFCRFKFLECVCQKQQRNNQRNACCAQAEYPGECSKEKRYRTRHAAILSPHSIN